MANEFRIKKGLIVNETDLYVSGSKTGIGTDTPSQTLTVAGNISGSGNLNVSKIGAGAANEGSLGYFLSNVNNAGSFPVGGDPNTAGLKIENDNTTAGSYASVFLRSYTGDAHLYASTTGTSNAVNFGIWLDNTVGGAADTRFFIEGQTGNVGIGTTSPGAALHVSGSAGGTAIIEGSTQSTLNLKTTSGGVNNYIAARSDGDIAFSPGGSEKVTLQSDGKVGIGTTSPSYELEVRGSSADSRIYLDDGATGAEIYLRSNGSGEAGLYISSNSRITRAGGDLNIIANAIDMNLSTNNGSTNHLRIDTSGNVTVAQDLFVNDYARIDALRVGTTSTDPGDGNLYVEGDVTVGGKVTAQEFHTEFVSASIIYQSGSTKFGDTSDDVHSFSGSLRVTGSGDHYFTDGNVGIGTTSPSANLHVNPDTINEIAIAINGTQNYSANNFQRISAGDPASLNRLAIGFGYNSATLWTIKYSSYHNHEFYTGNDWGSSTERMRINSSGDTIIGGTSKLTAYSDTFRTLSIQTPSGDNASILELAGNRNANPGNQNAMIQFFNKTGTATEVGRISSLQGSDPTSGSIAFHTRDSGTFSEKVRIDSNGNVGIGTTSPSVSFHVEGSGGSIMESSDILSYFKRSSGNTYLGLDTTSTGADSGFRFGHGGTRTWTLLSYKSSTTDGFAFFDHSTSSFPLMIREGGNVGIGTTSPTSSLHVQGVGYFDGGESISFSDTVSDAAIVIREADFIYTRDGDYLRKLIGKTGTDVIQIGQAGTSLVDEIRLLPGSAGFTSFYDNSSESMRITGGNVGIGTTSPTTTLEVRKDSSDTTLTAITSGNDTISLLNETDTTNNYTSIGFVGNAAEITARIASVADASNGRGNLVFLTGDSSTGNPVERMRINSSGRLFLGTATIATANTAADDFVIKGEGTAIGMTISNSSDAGTGTIFFGDSTDSAAAGFRYNHNTGDMAISAEDNITIAADAVGIGTTSPSFAAGSGLEIERAGIATLRLQNTSTGKSTEITQDTNFEIDTLNTGMDIVLDATTDTIFEIANSEIARINSTGLGIGTTGPSTKLHLTDTSAGFQFTADTGTAGDGRLNIGHFSNGTFIGTYGDDGGAADLIRFGTHSGDERMRIDSSGNVGIGTTSIDNRLHVQGGGMKLEESSGNIDLRLTVNGDNKYNIGYQASGDAWGVYHNPGSAYRIYVTGSNGNVGIGTTSPDDKLHVVGNLFIENSSPEITLETGASHYNWQIAAQENVDAGLEFSVGSQDADASNDTFSPLMTIKNTGKVGIGTTNPFTQLHVDAGANYPFEVNSTQDYMIGLSRSGTDEWWFKAYTDGRFAIHENGVGDKLTIKAGGNVGIGTNSPNALLHVSQASANTVVRIGNNTTYDQFIYFNGNNDWSLGMDYSNSNAFVLSNASSIGTNDRVVVTTSGNVGIGTTSPIALLHINGTGDAIRVESTNTGVGGAQMDLLHFTTSPADNDVHGSINFGGYYSGTNSAYGSAIKSIWTDVSAREGQLEFYTRDDAEFAARMAIDKDGNVGIGTTSPDTQLHIVNSGNGATSTIKLEDDAREMFLGRDQIKVTGLDGATSQNLYIQPAGDTAFATTSGNVGIGITSPGAKLDVNGKIRGDWAEFTTVNNTDPGSDDLNVSGYGILGNRTTNPVYLHNYGNGGIRISSNAALGTSNGMLVKDTAVTVEGSTTVGYTTFNSGFGGNGWRIDGNANAEFENLTVRGTFSVYELLAQQIRATNGSLLVATSGKVDTSTGGSTGTLTFDTGNVYGHGFLANDIILAQRLDTGGTSLKRSFLRVDSRVDSGSLTYTVLNGDNPEAGQEFVRIGNTSNTDRQGHIYLTADDSNAPYIGVRDGVDAYTDFTSGTGSVEKVRVGRLDGVTSANFGSLSGYGLWASGSVYLEGGVNATFGLIGGWTLNADSITGGDATLAPTGNLTLGQSNDVVRLSADDGTYRLWTGHATAGSAPFRVTKAGAVTATSATITGNITATSGTIGGWTAASTLSATNILLDPATPKITLGAKASLTDANTGAYIGTDGLALGASSVFKVTDAGVLTATSATITGAITATSGTFTGTVNANAGNFTSTVNIGNGATTGTLAVGTATNKITIVGTNADTTTKIHSGTGTYNNTNTGFYMDASGRFSLKDKLTWDGTTLTVTGGGTFSGDISAASGTFTGDLSGANISGGTIDIGGADATSFHVDSDGQIWSGNAAYSNAPFRVSSGGAIRAQSGLVGGWTVGASSLTGGSGATTIGLIPGTGIHLGNAVFGSSPFRVTNAGALTATSATITGDITATNITATTAGNIAGFTISANQLAASSGILNLKANGRITGSAVSFTGGRIAGFDFTSTAFQSRQFDSSGRRAFQLYTGFPTTEEYISGSGDTSVGGSSIDAYGLYNDPYNYWQRYSQDFQGGDNQYFRIGDSTEWIFWNDTTFDINLDGATLGTLTLDNLSDQGSELTALTINGSNVVGYSELGSNAFTNTNIAVSSYSNATDNRVLTSTGTGGINGESNLTFNGSKLFVSGDVGIGAADGSSKLTIRNSTGGAESWTGGIRVENTSTSTGEAAVAFSNAGASGTGANQWIIGLNQSANFDIAYGTEFTNGNTAIRVSTSKNVGIGGVFTSARLDLVQSADTAGGGIRIRESDDNNDYWDIFLGGGDSLFFYYTGTTNGGFISDTVGPTQMNFTGQHRSNISSIYDNINEITGSERVGLIVSADGTYSNLDGGTEPTINDSIPNITLSTTAKDKRVFGVISDEEDLSDGIRTFSQGNFVSTYEVSGSEIGRTFVNSIGEGGIWVSNYSGSLENGDYITTSPIPGLGMKQDDDLLHNYTVAKITQDCYFNDDTKYVEVAFSGSTFRKQFVGCTYHCG